MTATTGIRFPEDLRDEIERHGEKNGRNFTAEVLYLIQRGLEIEKEEAELLAEAKAARATTGKSKQVGA